MKNFVAILWVMGMLFLFTFAGVLTNSEIQKETKENSTISQDEKNTLANQDSKSRKIWIFFKDKGLKNDHEYENALTFIEKSLTKKSIERRKKVLRNENIITFEDIPVCEDYIFQVKQLGVTVRTKSRWLNALSAEANPEQIEKIRDFSFVKEIKDVAVYRSNKPLKIEDSHLSKNATTTVVNNYNFDYGLSFDQLQHIRVPEVHQMGLSGKGVLICITDAGFRKDHEVFQHAKIIAERDFVFSDDDTQTDPNNPFDSSDRHGTITWSNLGGFKEGRLIGPAFGADFLLAKTENTNSESQGEEDYWVAAVEWADSLGAQVISSSLGYFDWYTFEDLDGNTAVITKAADRAVKLGIVVVTSAGNWRNIDWGHINPPADGDSVISVGAFNIFYNTYASFSSPGPTYDGRIKPEVVASGVNNYSADNGAVDDYKRISGTSVSCPLVAGVVALILEQHPTWTPIDVRHALIYTASQHDNPDNDIGWGIVDAYKAVFDTNVVISIENINLDDTNQGNGNGLPEPGETIWLSGMLSCKGKIKQDKYNVFLTTHDPFIRITDSVEFVDGLLSYGQVELINAFSFKIDPNVPENHLAEFELIIKDEIGGIWKQGLSFKIVIQRTITGIVSSAISGLGIPNALVTWTKINTDSNKIVEIDTVCTDIKGKYTLSLLGGKYAVQTSVNGYSTPDARILTIPAPNWLLNFSLKIADYKIDQYFLKIDTTKKSEPIENLTIYNTGNAPLFYTIQEDIPGYAKISKQIKIPEILLRSDPNDGLPYDLKDVYCEQSSNQLIIKVTTFQEIYSKEDWNLSIFLDTDLDHTTGQKVERIGADYYISYVESKTSLLKYNEGVWDTEIFNGTTSVGKKLVQFKFDPSLIGDVAKFHLVVMINEGGTSNLRIVRDIIPDDGGISKVTFSRYKSNWLAISQPFGVIPPYASTQVQLLISFPDLLPECYGTQLVLSTNSPKRSDTTIPVNFSNIYLDTEVANNTKSLTHFTLDQNYPNPFNNQTKIRFSLPVQSKVKLTILNSIGQDVITLCDSELREGIHIFNWDGQNKVGMDVSSGIYFIKFEAGKWNKIMKVFLLR